MTHVTTLLIVLALTGSPVANAACVSWCDSPADKAGATCRESIAEPMAISVGSSTCVALLAANPFLREEARITFQAQTSLGVFHASDTLLTGGARFAYTRGDCEAIDGRPAPTLVLRL